MPVPNPRTGHPRRPGRSAWAYLVKGLLGGEAHHGLASSIIWARKRGRRQASMKKYAPADEHWVSRCKIQLPAN